MRLVFILLISIMLAVFSSLAFCQDISQSQEPSEPPRFWLLKRSGEVIILPTPILQADEIIVDLPGDVTMEMVRIPAGSFMMGSNDSGWSDADELPLHEVNIEYDFYMGKTEITQEQWLAVMGDWPGTPPDSYSGMGNHYPAYNLSWNDCQNFINALNQLGQGFFRLPSEAEWEYACRAGSSTRFCFGNASCSRSGCNPCELDQYAWWCGNNPQNGTKPVGQLIPNDFGLYDMYGNVDEWCQDCWQANYNGVPNNGSAWEFSTYSNRVIRGGHWSNNAHDCRSANRNHAYHGARFSCYGLRVVKILSPVLSISSLNLNFGSSETELTFDISNFGFDILRWSIFESEDWLMCESSQENTSNDGTCNGTGNETISVIVDPSGLADGIHNTNVNIRSNGGSATVHVTMRVGSGGDCIIINLPNDVTMEMILIPAGSFLMGSTDNEDLSVCYPCEQPVHKVNINYDFYMCKTEITQRQWITVMGENPASYNNLDSQKFILTYLSKKSSIFSGILLLNNYLRYPVFAESE